MPAARQVGQASVGVPFLSFFAVGRHPSFGNSLALNVSDANRAARTRICLSAPAVAGEGNRAFARWRGSSCRCRACVVVADMIVGAPTPLPPRLLRGPPSPLSRGEEKPRQSTMVNRVLTSPLLWYPVLDAAGGPAVHDVQDDPPSLPPFATPFARARLRARRSCACASCLATRRRASPRSALRSASRSIPFRLSSGR